MSQGMGSPVLRRFLDLHASVRAMQQGAYIHHWEQDLVPRFFQLDGRCRSLSWRANEADSHIIDEVQLSDLIDLDFGETFALADLESQASTYRHTKEVLVSPFLTLIAHTQAIRLVFSSWREFEAYYEGIAFLTRRAPKADVSRSVSRPVSGRSRQTFSENSEEKPGSPSLLEVDEIEEDEDEEAEGDDEEDFDDSPENDIAFLDMDAPRASAEITAHGDDMATRNSYAQQILENKKRSLEALQKLEQLFLETKRA
eukprot:m.44112 g.44112  ORF g.44112 m.44112 type:complete len:256 (-) comp46917_c0_seq1:161-928(-)